MADQLAMTARSLVSDLVAFWSSREPERTALIEPRRTWTYRELDGAVQATGAWLSQSGVRPGDRVMLVCENCCAAVAVFLACAAIRAWPVIVNARLSEREVDEIAEHSGARRIVFTTAVSPRAKAHAERLGATLSDPAGFGAVGLSPQNDGCAPEPLETAPEANVAALIYTSGTTGKPKGVMLSHANLMFVARVSGVARALTPDDRVYAVLPVSHILGLTGVLLGSLFHGASVELVSRFDPASALKALGDGVSVMIGTPSMYAMIAEYASRKQLVPIASPSLRLISSAGAPLDAATKGVAEAAFAQTLHNGYGITECAPTITLTPLDAPRGDCGIGRLLPGIEARIAGEDTGELFVRSPGVMKGYYRAPEETAAVIDRDGWFRTGDLARFEGGSWFIAGRAKEMIIRFGFNVYPAEIEGVLNAHPGVARSAVIGRQKDGSEEILAFIDPAPGSTATVTELSDYAAAKLAPYKRPSEFFLVRGMPLSPAGKILKSELAALAAR
jgi:acyl-CoA synthetase (AMP-forming)/AMP-acid ligase II